MRRKDSSFVPYQAVNLFGFGWCVCQGGIIVGMPVPMSEDSAIQQANSLNKMHGIPAQYIKVDSQTATNNRMPK